MPAFTFLVVPEGPSCETQPGSKRHLIPQQTRPGFFTASPRAQQEGKSCNMQASYKLLLGLCLLLSHWSNQTPSQSYCGRDDPSGRYGEA